MKLPQGKELPTSSQRTIRDFSNRISDVVFDEVAETWPQFNDTAIAVASAVQKNVMRVLVGR